MWRGLIALALTAAGAGCSDSFECATDSHCERDGVAGFCESIGHCSFPDEMCETGRRFGDLAGSLSSMCVPPPDDAGTSGAGSSTSGAPTATATMSESSGGLSGTSTTPPGSTGSGLGESSTGPGEVSPCNTLLEDTFPGDALSETWLVQGSGGPAVSAGAVRFTIDPRSVGAYQIISAQGGAALNLADGWITLNLESVPQIIRTQGTLTLGTDTGQVMVLYEGGGIRPSVAGESQDHSGSTAPWLRVAFEGGAGTQTYDVVFLESEDGQTWTEIARAADADVDVEGVRVTLTAGSWDTFAIPQEFAVRSIEICGRSGL